MKYLLFLVAKPMKADMILKLQSKENVTQASLKCKSFKEEEVAISSLRNYVPKKVISQFIYGSNSPKLLF